jgi:hypothetical protein
MPNETEEFIAWVVEQHEQMPADQKQKFLAVMKHHPETAAQVIHGNLDPWALDFMLSKGEQGRMFAIYDYDELASEVHKRLQEHFAPQIAAVA